MTSETFTPKRMMAVNPGMQYLGIAIFEAEDLIWYGIKTFPGDGGAGKKGQNGREKGPAVRLRNGQPRA